MRRTDHSSREVLPSEACREAATMRKIGPLGSIVGINICNETSVLKVLNQFPTITSKSYSLFTYNS